MEVIITEWGLQSYIDLKSMGIFTEQNYTTQLRPDVELLKTVLSFLEVSYEHVCDE